MTTFREMFGELSAWGRFWLYLGLATLAVAAAMSFSFGAEISLKHALFLACLTFVAAFLPEAAYSQWERGRSIVACVLAGIAIPTLAIEFYTHAGYTAGLRGVNIESAGVQKARLDGANRVADGEGANVDLWRKQLATLLEQNAWAGTVKADGLRAQISSMDEAIRQEERRGGCGPKCLKLMKDKSGLEERIAIAEKASDLTSRIEATQRVLNSATKTAAAIEYRPSAVNLQNEFLAKTAALFGQGSLEPSRFLNEGAQQTVNLAMALAGTGLPALALFIAGLYRRHDDDIPQPPMASTGDEHREPAPLPPVVPPMTVIRSAESPLSLRGTTIAALRQMSARSVAA